MAVTSGVTELGPTIGGGATGVTSLNSLSGALNLAAGSNITITPSGSTITIASTGGGGGTPGGLNLQLQYNNAGAFGGDTAVTDGSGNISLTSLAASNLTASTALVSNSSKFITSSTTTATELGYVSGVTSAIQTQLNSKQATGNFATSGSGDVSWTAPSGAGPVTTTLATVNSNVGSFTNANITVNAKGLITAAANGSSGTGTVSSVSVVSVNGLAGTVATATTTPAITLSTTVTAPVLAGNGTAISAATTTGTGSTVVLATSPTLITPALGTPSALVGTNITGTAAGLTAGTVTTNANLTGDVTSVGNATTLATVNSNTGSFGSSTSIPSFTVNGKGLITAASGNVVIAPAGTLSGTTLNSTVVTSSLTALGVQTQPLNMGSNVINAVTDPTTAQQAATKNYVDMAVAALQPLASVYAASTVNIPGTYINGVAGVGATFTTTSTTSPFTLDGATPPLLSRLLIKNQSSGFQNGVYQFTTAPVGGVSGAIFTRTLDYDSASDMNSAGLIPVINGTTNALSSWQQVATITTVGTDSLVFTEFTANPSLYMLKANNLSDVASATTSFNNISPMTTVGDLIYENATPSAVRLPIGTTGQVLTVTAGLPQWSAPGSGLNEAQVFARIALGL